MTLRKTKVCMDGLPGSYEAFVEDRLWNGWSTPWFTGKEARKIMDGINEQRNENVLGKLVYDDFLRAFIEVVMYLDGDKNISEVETSTYTGRDDLETDDGLRHLLFPVGNTVWCWYEPEEGNGTPDDSHSSPTNTQL